MNGFSSDALKIETVDGRNFTLLEGFTYTTKSGDVLSVPAGMKSDGASTPKVIWNMIPPFGIYWKATVLHDYMYRYTNVTRKYADNILLEAMEILGAPFVERETIYKAVTLCGEAAFSNDRKAQ